MLFVTQYAQRGLLVNYENIFFSNDEIERRIKEINITEKTALSSSSFYTAASCQVEQDIRLQLRYCTIDVYLVCDVRKNIFFRFR